jgi:hypothetical protein
MQIASCSCALDKSRSIAWLVGLMQPGKKCMFSKRNLKFSTSRAAKFNSGLLQKRMKKFNSEWRTWLASVHTFVRSSCLQPSPANNFNKVHVQMNCPMPQGSGKDGKSGFIPVLCVTIHECTCAVSIHITYHVLEPSKCDKQRIEMSSDAKFFRQISCT